MAIAAKFGDTNIYESRDVGEMIFHFFDEVEEFSSGSSSCGSSSTGFDGGEGVYHEAEEEDDEAAAAAAADTEGNGCKADAAKAFWDSQEEPLLSTLRRTTSFESKIRKATKEALMELNTICVNCACQNRAVDGCRKCMLKEVCDRLQKDGFSCSICKSKWKSSQEIPAGEHTYLEVVQNTTSKGEVKVIIELNFKSEFMMARGCEEYNRLLERLPDVYIGKTERLKTLIKILCSASKKCMKENKMHMAPWRKHKYMQAKWLGKPEKQRPTSILPELHMKIRPSRPKASMLTFDFSDNLKTLLPATMIKVL
ncbi:uncharacterized protein [Coffea arabica]|uniref:Uncharacterized protein n=1 Tax=Coffea arabica TaxID=13443 RepID=A0A6P6SDS3_COFAR|nr:uncharacterized protein LOC113690290 [Coffea arabica]